MSDGNRLTSRARFLVGRRALVPTLAGGHASIARGGKLIHSQAFEGFVKSAGGIGAVPVFSNQLTPGFVGGMTGEIT
jgi:hypothetical protein